MLIQDLHLNGKIKCYVMINNIQITAEQTGEGGSSLVPPEKVTNSPTTNANTTGKLYYLGSTFE